MFSLNLQADALQDLTDSASLIFEDQFERVETDNSKEELGQKWVTNSKSRAKGDKQADLTGSTLMISMSPKADHGVSVRHDAPFDDGVVWVKFKIFDEKGIGFNFNDPKCKESHAGHICHFGVKPTAVDFRDGKTGTFANAIYKKKKSGASKAEIKELLKGKSAVKKMAISLDQWHEVIIHIQGASMTTYLDNVKVDTFTSEGIDHAVKQNMAFAVSGKAEIDALKIWSLD